MKNQETEMISWYLSIKAGLVLFLVSVSTDWMKQNFFQTTLDDANYYVEKKTKQFDISEGKSNLRRTETTTKQWLEKQKRDVEQFTDEKKKDLGMTTSSSTKSKNPVEDMVEGCTSSENFNCNNCGLFST